MSARGLLPLAGSGDAGGHSGPLSRTDVFEMLRNRRRRYAFHYLRMADGPVTLGDLSDNVAAWEYETDVEGLDREQRQRVYVSLLQTHLPKMDDANVVDFDDETNTVELDANAADVQVYLEVVPDDDILWAQYYLGIAGLGTLYLVLVWIGLPPFENAVTLVGAAFLAAVAASAVLHHRTLRRRRLGADGDPV